MDVDDIRPARVRLISFLNQVEIEIIDSENGWSPYISVETALKLDRVRVSLQSGDVIAAKKYARKVYELSTVAA